MCSRDKYAYLSDFVWYLNVLVQLARLRGAQKHGALLASQLVDITMRVRPVRAFAARDALRLLLDDKLEVGQGLAAVGDVLAAAAWIAGEFASHLLEEEDESDDESDDEEDALPAFPSEQPRVTLVDVLTRPGTTRLPARVQAVYLQNTLKVINGALVGGFRRVISSITVIGGTTRCLLRSPQVEVQERATALKSLLTTLGAWSNAQQCRHSSAALRATVSERMVPVNPKAQARVPKPSGLDLTRPFSETTLTAFLEQPDPATKPCSFGEADETFDTGFDDDDDQFAETGGFYDIKGSDDESSGEEKKKKKKKDKKKKKKKKNPVKVQPGPRGPVLHRRRPRAARRRFCGRRARRAPVEEGTVQGQERRRRRSRGSADVYVEDSLPDGVSDDEGKRRVAASRSICGRCPGVTPSARAPRPARAPSTRRPSLATQEEEGQEEEARRRRRGRGPRRPGPVADRPDGAPAGGRGHAAAAAPRRRGGAALRARLGGTSKAEEEGEEGEEEQEEQEEEGRRCGGGFTRLRHVGAAASAAGRFR